MRRFLLLLIILSGVPVWAQSQAHTNSSTSPVEWNGYSQLRFYSNFNDVNSFSVRRMKLWLQSSTAFMNNWGFKVQTTLSSRQNEKFVLQDVMAWYKKGPLQVKIGQFVPQFSLQWAQPDYNLPLTERADVIINLIPDGTLGTRDLGAEANYAPEGGRWHVWLGAFNGNGIKEYRLDNSGFLLTQKTAFDLFNKHLYAGYSVMFRKADMLQLTGIIPDSVKYTGNDFRYDLFGLVDLNILKIQAEYIWADLGGQKADGWYLMALANVGKNQLVASWDNYNDAIPTTGSAHTFHFGYNYLVKSDKLKFMIDNGIVEYNRSSRDYFLTLQMQLFFM